VQTTKEGGLIALMNSDDGLFGPVNIGNPGGGTVQIWRRR
jgi:hypothetical protein